MRLALWLAPLVALSLSAPALADRAEIERFLVPGEVLVRHLQTSKGADLGITDGRLMVVARQNLVESHPHADITHGMVHGHGLSLRLKNGRILGLNVGMPENAGFVVELANRATSAEFQIQSGNRSRLPAGFTVADIERTLPPPLVPGLSQSADAATEARPETLSRPMPTDAALAAVSPVYLYVDLGGSGSLSAQLALREQMKEVPLTLIPADAKLFASAKVEKLDEADSRGTLLANTKMRSYTVVLLVKVGNRNGDVYASDRVVVQVLGISPEQAVKSSVKRGLATSIETAIKNYARVRAETGSPFVLQDPFKR